MYAAAAAAPIGVARAAAGAQAIGTARKASRRRSPERAELGKRLEIEVVRIERARGRPGPLVEPEPAERPGTPAEPGVLGNDGAADGPVRRPFRGDDVRRRPLRQGRDDAGSDERAEETRDGEAPRERGPGS